MIRVAVSKMSCRLCEMRTTREPLLGQTPDELEHLLGLRDAERGRRLVEDDELRVPHHRARDCHRLALSARERRDRLTDGLDRGDAKALERLRRTLLHRRLLEPEEEVPDLAAQVHVLHDVEVVAEREILVDDLDPELRRVLRTVDRDGLAVEEDLAGVVAVDPGDALDERRLAGAVVTDERHDLAGAHLEVDVGQRLHRAERLREVADLEEWCVAHEWRVLERSGGGVPEARLHRLSARLLAVLLVIPGAHLAPLEEPVRKELLVVRLRDRRHGDDVRRLTMALSS